MNHEDSGVNLLKTHMKHNSLKLYTPKNVENPQERILELWTTEGKIAVQASQKSLVREDAEDCSCYEDAEKNTSGDKRLDR